MCPKHKAYVALYLILFEGIFFFFFFGGGRGVVRGVGGGLLCIRFGSL